MPELIRKQIDHQALIAARRERQRKLAEKLGRRSRDHFEPGDKVVIQDVVSLKWRVKGVIMEGRTSEDGTVRSYLVKKENGKETIRSARHIKFAAIRENTKVRFEENLGNEASDDDADSENEARVDTAGKESMDTGSESEARVDTAGSMETESPAQRTRARTGLAGRLAVGRREAC